MKKSINFIFIMVIYTIFFIISGIILASGIGSFEGNTQLFASSYIHREDQSIDQLSLTKKVELLYTALKTKACDEEFERLSDFLAKRQDYDTLTIASRNLFVQDLPPVPMEIVKSTEKYTDFRFSVMVAAHPTSPQMIISTRPKDGKNMQLFTVNEPGGVLTQITNCERSVTLASYHPIHGNYCIFETDSANGREKFQIYRHDFEGETVLLTDGKSRNKMGSWSTDGSQIAYTSACRNGRDQDVYLMDPARPDTARCIKEFSDGDQWHIKGWSADDKELLMLEQLSACHCNLWSLNIEDGSKSLLNISSLEQEVNYSWPNFSKDGKSLFFVTDKDREFEDLIRLDLTTGIIQPLTVGNHCDIDICRVSPKNSNQIVYVANESGYSVVHLITLSEEGVKNITIPNIPKGIISNIHWDKTGTNLRFSVSSATVPTDVFSINLDDYKLSRWTETPSQMPTKDFSEPQVLTWKSFDGTLIEGLLYLPKKMEGKVAVQVIVHGGPESQSRPGFLAKLNYYLNELGIALVYPNIRGSTGYGRTFLKAANGMDRLKAYDDIGALLDCIKEHPQLDGDRIMVSGGSYGGHVAMAVATMYNDKIKCSLSNVGISNLVTFLQNTDPRRQNLRRSVYGDERVPPINEFLRSIAPVNNVLKIKHPFFIIQGREDPRVPFTESIQMVDSLKEVGSTVQYLLGMNEGHGFGQKDNEEFLLQATGMFINTYLLDK